MNTAVRCVAVGAGLEVVIFLSLSMQPPTWAGEILAYTLFPGAMLFRILFGTGLGQFIDWIRSPLNFGLAIAGLAAVAIFQAMVFALPIWCICRWWNSRRERSDELT